MSDAGDMDLGVQVSKSVLARLLIAGLGFVGTILFARLLGPTDFGGYYLLFAVLMIAKTPLEGWIGAIKKRYAEAETNPQEMFGLLLASIAVVGVLILVAAGISRHWLRSYTSLDGAWILFVLLLFVVVAFSAFQQLLEATGKVAVSNWTDLLRSALTLGFRIILILTGLGAAGMVYGLAGSTVVAIAVCYYYLRLIPDRPSRELLSSVYDYGRYSVIVSLVGQSYARLDQLLLGYFLGPVWVGYYEVAAKLSMPGQLVSGPIIQAILPKVSYLSSQDDDISRHVTNSVAFSSILAVPIFFGSLAISEALVVTTYSGTYSEATIFLTGVALYKLIHTQSETLQSVLNGIDEPQLNAKINSVTVVINLALGVVLVLRMGAVGVIIASVVAESVRYLLTVTTTRRYIPNVSIFPSALRVQALAGIVMFATVELLNEVVMINSWMTLLLVVSVGALVYTATLSTLSPVLRTTAFNIGKKVGLI